jgi:4,5-DOPA dioxygenase extradiol
MKPELAESGFDWAQRFDEEAKARMASDPAEVTTLDAHADFRYAVPTPDHFIPLLYIAGLAAAARSTADVLIDGYAYGSLSMTAYTLGLGHLDVPEDASGFPGELGDAPPAASNI